jgi:predicted esterase
VAIGFSNGGDIALATLLLTCAEHRMAPARSVDRLEGQLRAQRADVTRKVRAGSHGITGDGLAAARERLTRETTQPAT